ncbi:MAG TPA: MFS transporter [Candidatus Saccharibacteria bacterium]|nr:MFS transporter [Candidatus Saccharibacteria bacterium]
MKKKSVIAILAVSQFVMILDSTVMNVSISTVAADLGTTISGMQAAITFYALTMASLMLTGGKLGSIWGRHKAFKIGSFIYGIGSLITAVSPSLPVLLFGWSFIEGLGAILVIPAIAALAAVNYKGKERVAAFSILGAVTGLAAAIGPIIGGYFTTYLSWRYVFASEAVIMTAVLLLSSKIKDEKLESKSHLDISSVLMSASGMGILVLGVLQSKTWGWVTPINSPVVNGAEIAPLGISLTAYFIVIGLVILKMFMSRQRMLEDSGRDPLLKTSLLQLPILKSGLSVFMSQYFVIAALFFVVPVYLQTVLGFDALETGIKLVPLSIGLVIFSAVGSKLSLTKSPKLIVRTGQLAMALGSLLLLSSINPELSSGLFWLGMFIVGMGFGLLASQLGNVNMSAVSSDDTVQVGGLQGTYQNLGTSFGTALVGSIFMLTLTSGFISAVQNSPNLSSDQKTQISAKAEGGVGVVSADQANQYVLDNGGSAQTANTLTVIYRDSQVQALKEGMFFVFVASIASLVLARNLPNKVIKQLN